MVSLSCDAVEWDEPGSKQYIDNKKKQQKQHI